MSLDKYEIKKGIRNQGFFLIPNYFSKKRCIELKYSIDKTMLLHSSLICPRHPNDISQSDNRIYGAEHLNPGIKDWFFNNKEILDVLQDLYQSAATIGTILCQCVKPKNENFGSASYWHRDSFRRQYKAFIFLSDVYANDGAFQFYSGTHKLAHKFRTLLKLGFKARNLSSYEPVTILNKVVPKYIAPESLICSAGSLVFVDASVIHRGNPLLINTRYSLTYYMYKKTMPPHITALNKRAFINSNLTKEKNVNDILRTNKNIV